MDSRMKFLNFVMIKNMTSGSTHWDIYHASDGAGATFRFTNKFISAGVCLIVQILQIVHYSWVKSNSNRVNNSSQDDMLCLAQCSGLQKFGK